MKSRLLIFFAIGFFVQNSLALADRIKLTCLYNDGDEHLHWIELATDANGREKVVLTNFVDYDRKDFDLFENYAWGCSINDRQMRCEETWSMMEGTAYLSVTHKLSRTTGNYFRLGTGISKRGELTPHRSSAICKLSDQVTKLF